MNSIKKKFHQNARTWLNSLIKQRRYLISAGLCQLNIKDIIRDLQFLELHLRTYNYSSDEKMARFFIRHRNKIISLIPGKQSGSHESQMEKFNDLLLEAKSLVVELEPVQNQLFNA